jgi:hypothetical protein
MTETIIFDGICKDVIPPHCKCPDEKTFVLIYEHRSGRKVQAQWAPVGEEATRWANAFDMILECEIFSTGEIALYCHLPEEDSENQACDIAQNTAGDREPGKVIPIE